MKRHLTILTTSLLFCVRAFAAPADDSKHLFILSGQSNMAKFDPAVSFTPAVVAEFGKSQVILVKDALGGQPISRWYKKWKPAKGDAPEKTGDLYDRLMTKVNAAIKGQEIKTVTFIWMQGESDAKTGQASVYEASLKGLIAQLRTDMKRQDINVVIGRISDCQMKNRDWVTVRKAEVKIAEADSRGAWVDTDDLNDKKAKDGTIQNDLHYTEEGYKLLGERYANKTFELIKKSKN